MTEGIGTTTSRLATIVSTLRTRKEDAVRRVLHDGSPRDLRERAAAKEHKLELELVKMEKSLS